MYVYTYVYVYTHIKPSLSPFVNTYFIFFFNLILLPKVIYLLPSNNFFYFNCWQTQRERPPSRDGFSLEEGRVIPVIRDLPHLSRSWDEPFSVASFVIQSPFIVPLLRDITSVNPSNRLGEGSTLDQGITQPWSYNNDFLRIAYYLTWVLSAQLTTHSICGKRFTLCAGAFSILPRFGCSHRFSFKRFQGRKQPLCIKL